jgi:hypothetical protein
VSRRRRSHAYLLTFQPVLLLFTAIVAHFLPGLHLAARPVSPSCPHAAISSSPLLWRS